MWREKIQIHKTNKIAALYPSCKLLIVALYSLCTIIIGSIGIGDGEYPLYLIAWFLVVPLMAAATKILNKFWKGYKKILFISSLIFIVQSLLIPDEVIVAQLGFVKVYQAGLNSGITLAFSILCIAGIILWFFQCTESKEIARALEDSGMNHKATYVFISTLQMIDILGINSKTIMNAQRARGVETEGSLKTRMKAFFPSLVPLILGAITSSEERVLTLESKGFDVKGPKTHLFVLEKSGNEMIFNIIAILITVAILVWRILLWVL